MKMNLLTSERQIMYIAGYRGSGSARLCSMLEHCLDMECIDLDANGGHTSGPGKIYKTVATDTGGINSPLIYMVRDGRDVIVSSYIGRDPFRGTVKNEDGAGRHGPIVRTVARLMSRLSFSLFMRKRAADWVRHVKTWTGRQPDVIVRFEDMCSVPEETLKSLLLRIDISVSPEVIEEAVKQDRELVGHAPVINGGKAVSWRDYFTVRDSLYFREKTGDLLKMFGYDI
ncbi:MAG TPA: hypothetical protein ENH40_00815 [Nitrospirae bacterium]|nr:hypothetical protein [Nitrospirota bacterium]